MFKFRILDTLLFTRPVFNILIPEETHRLGPMVQNSITLES